MARRVDTVRGCLHDGGPLVTLNARSISAITLARGAPTEYKVTYWSDGIARFDGYSGQRRGAWDAHIDQVWFARASKLARKLQPGYRLESVASATLAVDTVDGRLVYEAPETDEPAEFWALSTLIDGMCQRTTWAPFDTSGKDDFSPFSVGTPVWMNVGEATATGFGLRGAVLVLAGARASTSTHPSLEKAYQKVRSELIDADDLVLDNDGFYLTRHLLFTSPSAAASVMSGSNTSGRRAWKDSRGRAWSVLDLDA